MAGLGTSLTGCVPGRSWNPGFAGAWVAGMQWTMQPLWWEVQALSSGQVVRAPSPAATVLTQLSPQPWAVDAMADTGATALPSSSRHNRRRERVMRI